MGEDAKQMLNNMRTATELTRGEPGMEDIVKKTRSEMNDFVAFYRRQPKVAGMPSFHSVHRHQHPVRPLRFVRKQIPGAHQAEGAPAAAVQGDRPCPGAWQVS